MKILLTLKEKPKMTHEQLLAEIKKLKLQETRVDSKEAFEFVIRQGELNQVCGILEGFFGRAFKSAGEAPTKEAWDYTANIGGIRENQILYYVKHEGISYCAMIWPWSNRVSVTVKIFQL